MRLRRAQAVALALSLAGHAAAGLLAVRLAVPAASPVLFVDLTREPLGAAVAKASAGGGAARRSAPAAVLSAPRGSVAERPAAPAAHGPGGAEGPGEPPAARARGGSGGEHEVYPPPAGSSASPRDGPSEPARPRPAPALAGETDRQRRLPELRPEPVGATAVPEIAAMRSPAGGDAVGARPAPRTLPLSPSSPAATMAEEPPGGAAADPAPASRMKAPRVQGAGAGVEEPGESGVLLGGARPSSSEAEGRPGPDTGQRPGGAAGGVAGAATAASVGPPALTPPGPEHGAPVQGVPAGGGQDPRGSGAGVAAVGGADPAAYAGYLAEVRQRLLDALTYPPSARQRGATGTVVVELTITPSGGIGGVVVVESSAHADLDEAVLRGIRRLRPRPFPPGLEPRTLRVRLPIVFRLE